MIAQSATAPASRLLLLATLMLVLTLAASSPGPASASPASDEYVLELPTGKGGKSLDPSPPSANPDRLDPVVVQSLSASPVDRLLLRSATADGFGVPDSRKSKSRVDREAKTGAHGEGRKNRRPNGGEGPRIALAGVKGPGFLESVSGGGPGTLVPAVALLLVAALIAGTLRQARSSSA